MGINFSFFCNSQHNYGDKNTIYTLITKVYTIRAIFAIFPSIFTIQIAEKSCYAIDVSVVNRDIMFSRRTLSLREIMPLYPCSPRINTTNSNLGHFGGMAWNR